MNVYVVNCNRLTATSLEWWLVSGIVPILALFQVSDLLYVAQICYVYIVINIFIVINGSNFWVNWDVGVCEDFNMGIRRATDWHSRRSSKSSREELLLELVESWAECRDVESAIGFNLNLLLVFVQNRVPIYNPLVKWWIIVIYHNYNC